MSEKLGEMMRKKCGNMKEKLTFAHVSINGGTAKISTGMMPVRGVRVEKQEIQAREKSGFRRKSRKEIMLKNDDGVEDNNGVWFYVKERKSLSQN